MAHFLPFFHRRKFRVLVPLVCAAGMIAAAAQTPSAPNPLAFQIGAFQFTPGGFLDFTTVYRSTNVGSGIGTNFAGIPYSNTVQGRVSEIRLSAQNSRLALKVSGTHNDNPIYAYLETDFLGNQPGNVAVSSNSDTMRLRVFFVSASMGKWEAVAGQDWSMLTPGKTGLSPLPSNIFYTAVMDTNYQVGLIWARQPQFRLLYHASPNFSAGLSIEQGEPYIGGSSGAPTAVLPPGTVYPPQVDNGSSNFSAPGFTPDFIVKAAYDSDPNGHGLHLEAAALGSTFRIFTPATNTTDHATGGAISVNGNLEIAQGFRLIANSYFGDGGGRYFFGMAPDMVIRNNGQVSTVRSSGGMAGFEYQANPQYLIYSYYGVVYILPSFDLSGATPVGYGFPGAPNSMNRSIQEGTLGVTHTFWSSPQYGSIQLITQGSYLTRSPYEVAPGTPKNAHTGMGFVDLRYNLP